MVASEYDTLDVIEENNSDYRALQKLEKKIVEELIPSTTKITDQKLNPKGRQYHSWKRVTQLFLGGAGRKDHITKEPPTDALLSNSNT